MKRYIGERKKLKIYIDSDDKFGGKPLWEAIVREARDYGLAGATVYKAVAGMGAHSELHTFSVFSLSQKLPLIIEIIDTEPKIRGFLSRLDALVSEGLVTLESVEVVAYKHPKFGQ